jgi:DNA-damage-inducible protein J
LLALLSRSFVMTIMTTTADTFVRARIDTETKDRATAALQAMGLSVSDALRILLCRVANDQTFPLELKAPNAETRAAIEELDAGKGQRFASVDALMADLHADD